MSAINVGRDGRRVKTPVTTEDRATRLLRMLAALEESIIRLEVQRSGDTSEATRRLRLVQGEILRALHLLEGDFQHPG